METTIIQYLLADLFFTISNIDIPSYADDNMPYITVDNINDLIKSLEEVSTAKFQWFDNNFLKTLTSVIQLLKLAKMRMKKQ